MDNLNEFIKAIIVAEIVLLPFIVIAGVVSILKKNTFWLKGVGVVQLIFIIGFMVLYLLYPILQWVYNL